MGNKSSKASKAVKKTGRIVFGVIAGLLFVVAVVFIAFAISWFVSGTNTTAAKIVILIIGLLALFVSIKIVQKIRDGIRREKNKASSRTSNGAAAAPHFEPKANRTAGSEGELRRAITNALPSAGSYLGSWEHGESYLRSISVEMHTSTRKVVISGNVEFKIEMTEYYSESHVKYAAQSHLDSVAGDLADKAVQVIEEYISNYSGLDGDWNVAVSGLTASFLA